MLTGCKTYNSVTVAVSNANGEPISGASVQMAPMYFFNPTSESHLFIGAYDILEPFPAKGDQGRTDENGNVTLQVITGSPLQLNVYAEGFSSWSGQVAITKQGEPEIKQVDSNTDLVVTAN